MAIVNPAQDDLTAFEDRVADAFNDAKIPAPVHLYSNNEQKMIEVFREINENDWVFCSWRSHYQCLLGVFRKKWLCRKYSRENRYLSVFHLTGFIHPQ